MTSSAPGPVEAGRHRVTLAGAGQSFEVPAGERILGAARRAGIWLPFECGWGSCGSCKATVAEGTTELLFPQAPCVDPRDERRRRVALCQSTPTSDLVLKPVRVADEPLPERPTRDHRARLARREDLGPGTARFTFALDDPAVYRPGQHAILGLGAGLRRCYSMAGLPGSTDVTFVAKRYPGRAGSGRLFELAVGSPIDLELPYGDMWLRDSGRPVVLVAGGTGISAILGLALQLAAEVAPAGQVGAPGPQPRTRPVHVFYGAATPAELVCWGELEAAVAARPGGRLHGCVASADGDWRGTVGFVTGPLAEQLPDLADADFYLAGPPPMTDAVRALLRTHDVGLDRIWYDSFG